MSTEADDRRELELLRAANIHLTARVEHLARVNENLVAACDRYRSRVNAAVKLAMKAEAERLEAVEQVQQLTALVEQLRDADDAAGVAEVERLLGLPTDDLMGIANAVREHPAEVERDHKPRLRVVPRQGGTR